MASVRYSSASKLRTQSWVQSCSAAYFCCPKPSNFLNENFAPLDFAISSVLSVLPESSTTISSAKSPIASKQPGRFFSSFFVIMKTDSLSMVRSIHAFLSFSSMIIGVARGS